MKFSINNVGKVNDAEIETNGVTVIAGYNDTGKTTILKAIDVSLKSFAGREIEIENERWKSINKLLLRKELVFDEMGFSELPESILYDIFDGLRELKINPQRIQYENFENIYYKVITPFVTDGKNDKKMKALLSDEFVRKLYDGLEEIIYRSTQDYWEYLVTLNLRKMFGNQTVNLMNRKDSVIVWKQNEKSGKIVYNEKLLLADGEELPGGEVIYMETRNLLDDFERLQWGRNDWRIWLNRKEKIEVYEQYNEIEKNKMLLNDIFKDVLHGKLKRDEGALKYQDEKISDAISLHNIASGMKSLLILQRLVENGTLKSGSWLLIDEPETNLHSEWHIKMAEILVLMKKEMNINVIVSSHSAYFIRALEVKLAANQMKASGKFYLMEQSGNMFDAKDVTENTERIYAQLYKPLEEL